MYQNIAPVLRATATYIRPGVHAGVATAVAIGVFYGTLAVAGGIGYGAYKGSRATIRGVRRAGSFAKQRMPMIGRTASQAVPTPLAASPYVAASEVPSA